MCFFSPSQTHLFNVFKCWNMADKKKMLCSMGTILIFLVVFKLKKNLSFWGLITHSPGSFYCCFPLFTRFPWIPFIFCFHLTDPPILTQISSFLYCTAFPILLLTAILFPHQLLISCISPSFCPSSNLLYSSVLYHFFSSISTKACLPPRLPIHSVLSCLWLPFRKP